MAEEACDKRIKGSLAVVLPRFGDQLGGGAETLVKSLVDRLVSPRAGTPQSLERVEVWTTCAIDHRTWANFHAPGSSVENGIVVRRFAVSPRNTDVFIRAEIAIQEGRPLSIDEQLGWLANSVNSSDLYAHIAEHGLEFDAILFAPYLFATSFWGALIHAERSVIVPCLHNEAYAYLGVFRHLFGRVRGLVFNAEPEAKLAQEIYCLPGLEQKSAVVGMGFDSPNGSSKSSTALFEPHVFGGKLASVRKPYLLYSGRKELGKNLDLLMRCFEQSAADSDLAGLQLVIIGAGEISFRDTLPDNIIDVGFVSEEEKTALMRHALALCQPSTNESFSIVMMEAWLQSTPVIVHADCAVTRDHVVKSGGGLFFSNAAEFSLVVNELVRDPEQRQRFGQSGRQYVEQEYCWTAVGERLKAAFDKFGLFNSPVPKASLFEAE